MAIKNISGTAVTVLVISLSFAVAILLSFSAFSVMEKNKLQTDFNNVNQMREMLEGENKALKSDKEKLKKETEKLQTDSSSFLEGITQAKEKNAELIDRIKDLQKTIDLQEKESKRKEKEMTQMQYESEKAKGAQEEQASDFLEEKEKVQSEIKEAKDKIEELQKKIKSEKALYHYNLGVAYAKTKMYKEAIKEYENSLVYDSGNAEAYYNLGLLYENVNNDTVKAVQYYQKYLDLRPDVDDKEEVRSWIISGWIDRLNYKVEKESRGEGFKKKEAPE